MITEEYIQELEKEMLEAAEQLEFERAAALRDRVVQMQDQLGEPVAAAEAKLKESRKGARKGRKGRSQIPRPKSK